VATQKKYFFYSKAITQKNYSSKNIVNYAYVLDLPINPVTFHVSLRSSPDKLYLHTFHSMAISQPKITQPENLCSISKDLSYRSIL
jgi:hypothetical protein